MSTNKGRNGGKPKAWRLGAAILKSLQMDRGDGRMVNYPAARRVKSVAQAIGSALRNGGASSRHVAASGRGR